jgi:NTE family protein
LRGGHDAATLKVGEPLIFPNVSDEFGAVYLGITRDTLDNSSFPGNGSRFDFEYQHAFEALGSEDDGDIVRLTWDKALSRGRNRVVFGTRLASEISGENLLRGGSLLGGFLDLSGFADRQLFGEQLALGRVVGYRSLGNESALFSLPFYVGASVEAGNVWASREEVSLDSLIVAGSVFLGFESILGPVFIGYGRAEGGSDSVYLTFGSLIRTDR